MRGLMIIPSLCAPVAEAAGGKALAVQLDLRSDENITKAVETAAKHFGGIDM